MLNKYCVEKYGCGERLKLGGLTYACVCTICGRNAEGTNVYCELCKTCFKCLKTVRGAGPAPLEVPICEDFIRENIQPAIDKIRSEFWIDESLAWPDVHYSLIDLHVRGLTKLAPELEISRRIYNEFTEMFIIWVKRKNEQSQTFQRTREVV